MYISILSLSLSFYLYPAALRELLGLPINKKGSQALIDERQKIMPTYDIER